MRDRAEITRLLAAPTDPAAIEPFGFRLERVVHRLIAQLEPRRAYFQ